VQVEHIDAVNNLEEILDVEGVDGFIVGPYDLSGSLGVPGQFENKNVKEALEKVRGIAQRRSASSGFHVIPPDPDKLLEKIRDGYTFLAFSLDILFLVECAGEIVLCPKFIEN
jgi:2-dehydro-3-deoxyglucarate aldolase